MLSWLSAVILFSELPHFHMTCQCSYSYFASGWLWLQNFQPVHITISFCYLSLHYLLYVTGMESINFFHHWWFLNSLFTLQVQQELIQKYIMPPLPWKSGCLTTTESEPFKIWFCDSPEAHTGNMIFVTNKITSEDTAAYLQIQLNRNNSIFTVTLGTCQLPGQSGYFDFALVNFVNKNGCWKVKYFT